MSRIVDPGLLDDVIAAAQDGGFATAGWVDWYNHRRLHGSLGMTTPVEYEDAHYAALNKQVQPA